MDENKEVVAAEAAEEVKEEVKEVIPSMDDFKEELEHSYKRYKEGDVVTGSVIGITENEVTLDLGAYAEGIVPLEELSNDPRFSIKADVTMGEVMKCTVIREDNGNGALVLSRKNATNAFVWDELREAMENGEVFSVKIAESVPAGVVTFLKDIRAFIPASQITTAYVEDTSEYVGKILDVKVITVDAEKGKLVLSGREVARERLENEKKQKISSLQVGLVVEGTVEKITTYGAFVSIGDGISGLLHISQISRKRIESPREVIKEGEKVKVKILSVQDGKVSLSMKAALEDDEVVEDVEAAPIEYKDEGTVSTGLAGLLAGLKIDN